MKDISRKLIILLVWIGISQLCFSQTQKGADINGVAPADHFGFSVSMPDANTIAIGAMENDGNGNYSGQVQIYIWNGSAWIQKGVDIYGESDMDWSGYSVSMPDANTVAIGAPLGKEDFHSRNGYVRIYKWNGSAWVQKGENIYGEPSRGVSGWSVSMPDANTVAIGDPDNTPPGFLTSNDYSGHVRIFYWDGTEWRQKGMDIDSGEGGNRFGWSVSMPDANTIAIGAIWGSMYSGYVRVYKWEGSAWIQIGSDILGEATSDYSGYSVSMPDINTVAIGAPSNDGNGDKSGHVRVYEWNGNEWFQKGTDIDGKAVEDKSGSSVSMPDSNTLAIGASYNNSNTGHVRIYNWNGNQWIQRGIDIDGKLPGDKSGCSVCMPDANTVGIGAYTANKVNGALGTGQVRIFSLNPLDLVEGSLTEKFKSYPNPTTGHVIIEFDNIQRFVKLSLFTLSQQLIKMESYKNSQSIQFDCSVPNGLYLLIVEDDQNRKSIIKLTKE